MGGITLKGATDKTFNWTSLGAAGGTAWWSSENLDMNSGKGYYVNSNPVLNQTTLGATVLASSLTSLGTIGSLVATTADINAGTVDAVIGGTTPTSSSGLNVYAVNYNVLRIMSGMGGLAYSN